MDYLPFLQFWVNTLNVFSTILVIIIIISFPQRVSWGLISTYEELCDLTRKGEQNPIQPKNKKWTKRLLNLIRATVIQHTGRNVNLPMRMLSKGGILYYQYAPLEEQLFYFSDLWGSPLRQKGWLHKNWVLIQVNLPPTSSAKISQFIDLKVFHSSIGWVVWTKWHLKFISTPAYSWLKFLVLS